MTTQQHASPAARPLTGAEYLESIRDGREVYIYGERVADVTGHPAFRKPTRIIARLYDALHDRPGPVLTAPPTPAPAATRTRSTSMPHSSAELCRRHHAIAAWSG